MALRSAPARSQTPAPRSIRRAFIPRSFRGWLSLALVALVTGAMLIVSAIVLSRLDAYFEEQEVGALSARALEVGSIVAVVAAPAAGADPVIETAGGLNAAVAERLNSPSFLSFLANTVAKADVKVEIGAATGSLETADLSISAAPGGILAVPLTAAPGPREQRETISSAAIFGPVNSNAAALPWGVQVTLSGPYTTRSYTLVTIATLLAGTAFGALLLVLVLGILVADRFTRPLHRLSEATRRFGDGDLTNRAPTERRAYTEVADLTRQFNLTADRLEESLGLIRRDRDRSREFLADVSHELRTPITAMRMNTEILQGPAGADEATRVEFLELSRNQLDRLDWMAQNLLELSKLESGLLALDLRPDDLRSTVESAVEQAEGAARRRGVSLILSLPESALPIHHDPPRIGQVIGNLIGNALKFTPPGGQVRVTLSVHPEGAQLEVSDTGAGIEPTELPRIFERFYRGSNSVEARGSGSGLGLAIVKSILDMHGGRISAQSQLGVGTTFTVILLADPKAAAGSDLGV